MVLKLLPSPEEELKKSRFHLFVHNKGQMYFPKDDEIFGSDNMYRELYLNSSYQEELKIKRTLRKAISNEGNICDEDKFTEASVTRCITKYLEEKIGCSVGMSGGDPEIDK